ncbi:MAG: enoyl-CoA hydratase/isomerase family protein [Actinomycetota bacterium]
MTNLITYEVEGPVATITLRREDKLNAINWEMVDGLDEAFNRAQTDDDVKAVVLTGAGKAFSVGDDLQQAWSGEKFQALMQRFKEHPDEPEFMRQFEFTKPVVVAINGYCFAGALELILWCDILIAADDAQFATQFVQYGLTAGAVTFYRLPRLVGHSNASYMLLTGERVGAEDALRMGLVTKVVGREGLLDEAKRIANTIAAFPEEAVRNTREGVRISLRSTLEGQRDITVFSNQLLAALFERMGEVQSGS